MGNWMIINASPRAPRSNSKRYAQMVSQCYEGTVVYCPLTKTNHSELLAKMDGISDLLFVFPLYADALPVPLLNFLKFLEEHPPAHRPTVSVLINCGFLEPEQNEIAVEMMRLFSRQNGYPFGSVLKIGSGEAILDSPFRFLAAGKIRCFARSIAEQNYQTFRVTMPLTRGMFVRAAEGYWVNYGKRNGVTKAQMQTMKIE